MSTKEKLDEQISGRNYKLGVGEMSKGPKVEIES